MNCINNESLKIANIHIMFLNIPVDLKDEKVGVWHKFVENDKEKALVEIIYVGNKNKTYGLEMYLYASRYRVCVRCKSDFMLLDREWRQVV